MTLSILQHKSSDYLWSSSIYTHPSTLPFSKGGTHCQWIGHRWFVGVKWRVSVHWLCVHSVTWCWSAETTRLSWDPDPNPSTSHVRCLRLAGWSDQVPYCGLVVLVRSTPRWYFHGVILSRTTHMLGFSMGHRSQLALRSVMQCRLIDLHWWSLPSSQN